MVMNSEHDKHDKILNDEIIMNHGQLYKYRYINYDNAHQIELKSLEIYCQSTIKKYMNYPIWLTRSLWPHDAIGRRISGRTFAQVMACCIREPKHFTNQCWFIIRYVLSHSHEGKWKSRRKHLRLYVHNVHLSSRFVCISTPHYISKNAA